MTLIEAAEMLGLNPTTLRVQIHRGRLKGTKVGRDWYVTRNEVYRYGNESLGRHGRKPAEPTEGAA